MTFCHVWKNVLGLGDVLRRQIGDDVLQALVRLQTCCGRAYIDVVEAREAAIVAAAGVVRSRTLR